jgi:putative SOS response-associated peptidase YedK
VVDTRSVSYVVTSRLPLFWILTCLKRASFVRHQIQQQGLPVEDAPNDDDVRETYNFAPGSYGLVYRADIPDHGVRAEDDEAHNEGARGQQPAETDDSNEEPGNSSQKSHKDYKYQLKAMKWGLIPFWTKRSPDYGSMLRTINCRDDSLVENRGMWNTMKQRKRCVVICQGFYEWLKKGPGGKEKIPHFVRRKDGQLMCFAGLWDCVRYEDVEEKLYTYTIITTDSNKQLKFLHDRMPVILDAGSDEMKTWLDPERNKWSKELQSILQPYKGELECYPVSKDVGKVGNNSPNFIVPVDSKENKKNIANFFGNAATSPEKQKAGRTQKDIKPAMELKVELEQVEDRDTKDHEGSEDNAPLPVPSQDHETAKVMKREHSLDKETSSKAAKIDPSPKKGKQTAPASPSRKTRSATSNGTLPKSGSPKKAGNGSQRITSFFGK